MILYILKFSACLTIFLLFYKLFLEKESIHKLKRGYLLGALISALVIPFLTFTYYTNVPLDLPHQFKQPLLITAPIKSQIVSINYLPIILWSIYGLGVFVFALKFYLNLNYIIYKIRHNPKQKLNGFTNVLLHNLKVPHTFFSFIFLNKQKFEKNEIPKEVFWHEQTHARQKHSFDVLFIEILQVVFWFNPLIYLTRHLIKLNHEFLADQAVLNKGVTTPIYQQILLAFSTDTTQSQLVNAINYSLIKKRFTVMKTKTSRKSIWLRSLMILPLFAILLYGFSEKVIIQKEKTIVNQQLKLQEKPKELKISKITPKSPSTKEFNKWKNRKNYAIWLDGKVIDNQILNNFKFSDIVFYWGSFVHINARSKRFPQVYQYHLYTKKGFEVYKKSVKEDENKDGYQTLDNRIQNVDKYKKLYKTFEALINKPPHYIYKTKEEQKILDAIFSELGGMYFRMMRTDKNKVNYPHAPISPYVKFIKNGKEVYKKQSELTDEDLKLLPFPPKRPSERFSNKVIIQKSKELTKDTSGILSLNKSLMKRSQNLEKYKNLYKTFEALKNKAPHYIYKTKEEQKVLDAIFSELGGMYFRMMRTDKNKVNYPHAPISPYVKFIKNGKEVYKKQSELTDEDFKLLPPPPSPKPQKIKKVKTNKLVKYILIKIDKNNKIILNDEIEVTLATITSEIKKITAKYNAEEASELRAVIIADNTVKMGFVNDVFEEAVKAGISMRILK